MKCRSIFLTLAILFFMGTQAIAVENAKIEGYVKDGKTGTPYKDVNIEVYQSDDHSAPVGSVKTDAKGYYSLPVQPGKYYDIYVRTGDVNPTQRTNSATIEGGVYTLNFDLYAESTYSNVVVEKYGFWIVVVVSFIVLAVILFDMVFRRGKKEEYKSTHLESATVEQPAESLDKLAKEKAEIESMIELSRSKYHKREIDEESFREIVRDQQKKLIEIEARTRSLKGDKKPE
ncbi:MAG: carboxypeptidase-like regulatory domain-containing protein [Candidatus Altiarchaeota archaeon]|nr:carboxypeptidase-like regulatory domain-containing protein [Candidatus Altiarchaeota archaeon]